MRVSQATISFFFLSFCCFCSCLGIIIAFSELPPVSSIEEGSANVAHRRWLRFNAPWLRSTGKPLRKEQRSRISSYNAQSRSLNQAIGNSFATNHHIAALPFIHTSQQSSSTSLVSSPLSNEKTFGNDQRNRKVHIDQRRQFINPSGKKSSFTHSKDAQEWNFSLYRVHICS